MVKLRFAEIRMKLISLNGNSQKLDAGAMFGNAPKALWSRWVKVDQLNRMQISCRCLLASDFHGKNVLFETGIGAFFEPHLKQRFGVTEDRHVLLDSLLDHGFTHEDIDVVVLSHLHFDHAGGLLTAFEEGQNTELLFPNAQFLVSAKHWQRAVHPHPRDRASFIPHLNELLKLSDRLHLVYDNHHDLLPGVKFEFTDGHTPGMMHSIISDLVFCADLIPGKSWIHIPITMGYDRYPELVIDEKSKFLKSHCDKHHRLFFTHDPEIAVAGIESNNGKYLTINEMNEISEEIVT